MNFRRVIWRKEIFFDNLAHVIFWTKGELFYKNPLKRSALKSQFQNPRNVDEKNQFMQFKQKQLQIHDGTKNGSNTFTLQVLTKCTLFYNQHFFFSSQSQQCLPFSRIELQMLLRCCLIHISIIINLLYV